MLQADDRICMAEPPVPAPQRLLLELLLPDPSEHEKRGFHSHATGNCSFALPLRTLNSLAVLGILQRQRGSSVGVPWKKAIPASSRHAVEAY